MIPVPVAVGIAAVCLVVEGFFSGSEIAMVAADRVSLRKKAEAGETGARLVLDFLGNPERMISTMLFGHNAAVVTATTVLTLAFIGAGSSEAAAVAVMTPIFLIFAEVVPKMLFQANADRLVTRIVYPLRVASIVFRPAIFIMESITGFVARLLKVEARRTLITRDELRMLIDMEQEGPAAIGGTINPAERQMIKSVLDFGNSTVYDVMVPLSEVTALPEDASIAEAAAEIADKQHTRVPVYRERVDQIVGVLWAHDVLAAEATGRQGVVSDLARPAIFVPESKPTADLLVELQQSRQHLAVVVDEYGGATGICTVEDILEEIVGEIDDEYDKGPSTIRSEGPGLWRVQARTPVAQVNTACDVDLPEGEDYESLAGLILEKLKRIPREGEQLRLGDVTLTVVSTTDRAIDEVRLRVARKR